MTHQIVSPPAASRRFTILLSATRRGARLARLLAVDQLSEWDVPFGLSQSTVAVVAEFAANAGAP